MGHMGWWRPFGLEAELEMADDPVDGCGIFDEGNDLHLTSTRRAEEEIYLIDLMFDTWKNGGAKTLEDRCRERVINIIETHQPEAMLEEKMIQELKNFIKKIEGS